MRREGEGGRSKNPLSFSVLKIPFILFLSPNSPRAENTSLHLIMGLAEGESLPLQLGKMPNEPKTVSDTISIITVYYM